MKKLFSIALLAGGVCLSAQAADPATVNGVAIKQSLVDHVLKDAQAQGKKVDDSARAAVVERLIAAELIDQEAKQSGLTKQPEFMLREQQMLQDLRVNAFLEDYLQKNVIDEASLRAEYDRLKALTSNKEYKASHILVKTEAEAKAIIEKLAKGESFAALAKTHSIDGSSDNGGDLGWFTPESMVQPFADAVAQLQKGTYSTSPVQTEFGWHVIRLEDVRATEPPAFESVKDQLRSEMQRQQVGNLIQKLRGKAKIVTQ